MQTGVKTKQEGNQPLAGCTTSMVASFLQAAGVRLISLSSCESESHSLIIKTCALFGLEDQLEHVVYTDARSTRQLTCKQGSGKVRLLSGKLPWVQERTAKGSFQFCQVPTPCNIADIGTNTLNKQRLSV